MGKRETKAHRGGVICSRREVGAETHHSLDRCDLSSRYWDAAENKMWSHFPAQKGHREHADSLSTKGPAHNRVAAPGSNPHLPIVSSDHTAPVSSRSNPEQNHLKHPW